MISIRLLRAGVSMLLAFVLLLPAWQVQAQSFRDLREMTPQQLLRGQTGNLKEVQEFGDPSHPAFQNQYDEQVRAVGFAPDGRELVAADRSGTIMIWDVFSGAMRQRLAVPAGTPVVGAGFRIVSLAYSPDGRQILAAFESGEVHFWEAASGQWQRKLVNTDGQTDGQGQAVALRSVSYSPDGRRLLLVAESSVSLRVVDVLDVSQGLDFTGHTAAVTTAAFSPDGRYLVTSSLDGTARVWDVATASILAIFDHGATEGSATEGRMSAADTIHAFLLARYDLGTTTGWINSAEFSPDGAQILTATGDGTAWIWDATQVAAVAAGQAPMRFSTADEPMRLSTGIVPLFQMVLARYSPDGRYIVAHGLANIWIWDLQLGEQVVAVLQPNSNRADYLPVIEFSPDGRFLANGAPREVKLFDLGMLTAASVEMDCPAPQDALPNSMYFCASLVAFEPGAAPRTELMSLALHQDTSQLFWELQVLQAAPGSRSIDLFHVNFIFSTLFQPPSTLVQRPGFGAIQGGVMTMPQYEQSLLLVGSMAEVRVGIDGVVYAGRIVPMPGP